jgi:hypothetical protein
MWCDYLAGEEWHFGQTPIEDPDVNPSEHWAVYSQHLSIHKVIGPLESGILTTLGYLDRAAYIQSKHGITMEKLEHINLIALKRSLDGKPQQMSIVKLIHRWNPTFGSLC